MPPPTCGNLALMQQLSSSLARVSLAALVHLPRAPEAGEKLARYANMHYRRVYEEAHDPGQQNLRQGRNECLMREILRQLRAEPAAGVAGSGLMAGSL